MCLNDNNVPEFGRLQERERSGEAAGLTDTNSGKKENAG